MSNEQLSPEVSERICAHMNKDHQDALLGYASFYGGVFDPLDVKMVVITTNFMKLLVDGELIEIPFEQPLENSHDAHQTLIAMIKKSRENIE